VAKTAKRTKTTKTARSSKKGATGRKKAGSRRPSAASRTRDAVGKTRKAGSRTLTASGRKQVARSRNAARAAASRSTRKGAAAARGKPSATAQAVASVKGTLQKAVTAVTKRLPGAGVDAITLLETDHRRIEDLLKRGEDTSETAKKTRKTLLDTIAGELTMHETIEERVLYPALEQYSETRSIVLEGVQEHHVADLIMKELYETSVSDEQWGAKFKVFKENIEHHIKEEEGPMFRTARGVMSREQLLDLGAKMARMKANPSKP
jgi:hemerythrin-like domain-containing protein